MLKQKVICAAVSALLCIQAIMPVMGAELSGGGELIFLEDYESVAEGEKPEYSANGWSLDN